MSLFNDNLTTSGAAPPANVFKIPSSASPTAKKRKHIKTYGKPSSAKKLLPPPDRASPTSPIPAEQNGDVKEPAEKSNRQKRKELKAVAFGKRVEGLKQTDPKDVTVKDGGDDAERRKRLREAMGSGATANTGKRRKLAAPATEFPLLNGTATPRVLDLKRRDGPKVFDRKKRDESSASPVAGAGTAAQLLKQREQLPIWQHRDALRQCLRDRNVLVMLGETGSGKSTQIGQFLVDEPWMKRGGCIAITQPRRVAAINLARRVAAEMGVRLGEEVGYSVRFENKSSDKTRIKFLTDGMLLQEMLRDPLLKRYSAVVVDEAHERTVGTDLVMGFLRKLVYGERRGKLKVVIMSATLEMEAMARFFEENKGAGIELPAEEIVEETPEAMETTPTNIEEPTNGDAESDKMAKKKKKKKNKGQYNPADLIRSRTPSPVREVVKSPEPEADGKLEGVIAKDERVAPYFGSVAVFEVPGRQYPVVMHYLEQPIQDYLEGTLKAVFKIHYAEPLPGDILVFLTGQEEIETLKRTIQEYATKLEAGVPKMLVLPLYAHLPLAQQSRIFLPTGERDTRKVILSTNIAETSVTVPGVRYVVDCGKAKLKQFRPKLGLESLLVTSISRSSAQQRGGRAGREAPGKCYRLFTEDAFHELKEATKPEILRTDLAHAILTLKARGQDDVVNFDYLSPPKTESLMTALNQLYSLGAFNEGGKITTIGKKMAKLPLAPPLARVLLAAAESNLSCLPEVVDVIAALSSDNLFPQPANDEDRVAMEEVHKAFRRSEGDHIMLLEVVRAYDFTMSSSSNSTSIKSWCATNYISLPAFKNLLDIRKQLQQYCISLSLADPSFFSSMSFDVISPDLAQRVLKSFLRGYFHQTARAAPDGREYLTVLGHQTVAIHPASILFGLRKEAIVYHEYVYTSRPFARWCSAVQLDWVAEAAPAGARADV